MTAPTPPAPGPLELRCASCMALDPNHAPGCREARWLDSPAAASPTREEPAKLHGIMSEREADAMCKAAREWNRVQTRDDPGDTASFFAGWSSGIRWWRDQLPADAGEPLPFAPPPAAVRPDSREVVEVLAREACDAYHDEGGFYDMLRNVDAREWWRRSVRAVLAHLRGDGRGGP